MTRAKFGEVFFESFPFQIRCGVCDKTVGMQKNVTVEVETRIGWLLAEQPDNDTIAHDLLLAPVWMQELIERNRKKRV